MKVKSLIVVKTKKQSLSFFEALKFVGVAVRYVSQREMHEP